MKSNYKWQKKVKKNHVILEMSGCRWRFSSHELAPLCNISRRIQPCDDGLVTRQSTQVSNPQKLGGMSSSVQIIENPVQMGSFAENSQEGSKLECIPVDKLGETHPVHSIPPVLPDGELECLLLASIELCKKETVEHMEVCQYQFQGIKILFTKILSDDASWKSTTRDSIRLNCKKLIELCVLTLQGDWFSLLDSLAVVFNPANKFHKHITKKDSETAPLGLHTTERESFAHPIDRTAPQGWLEDFIDRFGSLRGFDILLERFQSKRNLTIPVIHALIRPFGLCIEFLGVHTLVEYFSSIVRITIDILNNLIDDEFKNETTSDKILAILEISKTLITKIPDQSEMITELNTLKMKLILKILQISSFNGKMSALTEVNEIISTIKLLRNSTGEEQDCITAEYIIQWIKGNKVLEIALGDSLNQPEYVEKLERVLQFIIEERAFTLRDLDTVWTAQDGKHEAIVNNIHDLLTKLARNLSLGQLDHLFKCFKTSFKTATNDDRKQLLELMRRLAENNDQVTHKVLGLLWDFAHWDEVSTEIMEQVLNVHVKILETQTDGERTIWLDKCVEHLKTHDKWVLTALKQLHAICLLYEENSDTNDGDPFVYRNRVIRRLENDYSITELVITSLIQYMEKLRNIHKETPNIYPITFMLDNRYIHIMQVQERLNFIHFICTDGQYSLTSEEASQIWKCLTGQGVAVSDRDTCFKWFSKYIDNIPYWKETERDQFYRDHVSQLDPALLTPSGIQCFEKYFLTMNLAQGKLKLDNGIFAVDNVDLIGIEYLWETVRDSPKEVANRGIELLKQVYIQRILQKS